MPAFSSFFELCARKKTCIGTPEYKASYFLRMLPCIRLDATTRSVCPSGSECTTPIICLRWPFSNGDTDGTAIFTQGRIPGPHCNESNRQDSVGRPGSLAVVAGCARDAERCGQGRCFHSSIGERRARSISQQADTAAAEEVPQAKDPNRDQEDCSRAAASTSSTANASRGKV